MTERLRRQWKSGTVGEWLQDIGSPLPADCEWCGRKVKAKDVRVVKVKGRLFSVCPSCPPPDNANAMRT